MKRSLGGGVTALCSVLLGYPHDQNDPATTKSKQSGSLLSENHEFSLEDYRTDAAAEEAQEPFVKDKIQKRHLPDKVEVLS